MPKPIQVVIDTNVLVGALKSNRGASFELIFVQLGRSEKWEANISPALLFEYEEQAKRVLGAHLSWLHVERVLDRMSDRSNKWMISRPRRRILRDPDDDFILDLARTAQVRYIITYNMRNFVAAKEYGVETIRPGSFLAMMEAI